MIRGHNKHEVIMDKWKTLSYSQISSFTTCARKFELEYVHRLRLKRGDVQQSSLGDLVHHGIAAALRRFWELGTQYPHIIRPNGLKGAKRYTRDFNVDMKQAAYNAIEARAEQSLPAAPILQLEGVEVSIESTWSGLANDAANIVYNLLDELSLLNNYRVAEQFVDMGDHVLPQPMIEFALSAELTDNVRFSGVVDAVLYNIQTQQYELIDWKVRSRFTSYEQEVLNGQLALYQHVLNRDYGMNITTAVTYQIKDKAPRRPSVNKNGTMSRQAIVTTWAIYEQALLDSGLNPDDYRTEMQPKFSGIQFFEPIWVTRLPHVTQTFWENAVAFSNMIEASSSYPMALGYPCRKCPFAQLCTARIMGYGEEDIIASHYEVKSNDLITIDTEED